MPTDPNLQAAADQLTRALGEAVIGSQAGRVVGEAAGTIPIGREPRDGESTRFAMRPLSTLAADRAPFRCSGGPHQAVAEDDHWPCE